MQSTDSYRRELISALRDNARRWDLWSVWSDFVEMSAIALSNAVDYRQRERREARYLQIVKRYERADVDRFCRALAMATMAMEAAGFADVLGQTFMELELGNKWAGQFFTPYPVCQLMAKMQVGDGMHALIQESGFVTANDPAVGGGAMLIALAEAMQDEGINYQKHLHATAQDIDAKAAHMAYIQLSLLHVPAVVVVGNSLAVEQREVWLTPAHVLGGWTSRLRGRSPANAPPPPDPVAHVDRPRQPTKNQLEQVSLF